MTDNGAPVMSDSLAPVAVGINIGIAPRADGVHACGLQFSTIADSYTVFLTPEALRRICSQDFIDAMMAVAAEADKLNGSHSGLIVPSTRLEIPR